MTMSKMMEAINFEFKKPSNNLKAINFNIVLELCYTIMFKDMDFNHYC